MQGGRERRGEGRERRGGGREGEEGWREGGREGEEGWREGGKGGRERRGGGREEGREGHAAHPPGCAPVYNTLLNCLNVKRIGLTHIGAPTMYRALRKMG